MPRTKKPVTVATRMSGRRLALLELDKMFKKTKNLEHLQKALEHDFRESPMWFFKEILMPLMPREALVALDTPDRAGLRIVFDYGKAPTPPNKETDNGKGD